jgi:hypothetical protein
MLFMLSGIDPLNWLFATFLPVKLITGSLVNNKWCNIRRLVREATYRSVRGRSERTSIVPVN